MLIALTGPQGSGKSTLISDLTQQYGYKAVERKTARSVLADWNTTLDQIYSDKKMHMKFQDEILSRKKQDEQMYIDSNDVWLIERSYVDLFVYTCFNLASYNECSEWLMSYYDQCKTEQQRYKGLIKIKGGLFEVENDGVRSINNHFSTMIDLIMNHYTPLMTQHSDVIKIVTADRNRRVEIVHNDIQRLIRL